MDKIQFLIREILIAEYLIRNTPGSFLKRIHARIIALRLHNLLTDAHFFKANKTLHASDNKLRKKIRGELNALTEYYKEFYEKQRHKFAGHFQDIDLAQRIELWSKIDFESSNFFASQPIDIYKLFSSDTGFIQPNELFNPDVTVQLLIKEVSQRCDIERFPHFSSDILTHARFNAGGVIHFSDLQQKCGSLNALEIIIDYTSALMTAGGLVEHLSNYLKRILILDVVSYHDNLITRPDVASTDPQFFPGLDQLLNDAGLSESNQVLSDFKRTFKVDALIAPLRKIRDLYCAHVDSVKSIAELDALLFSVKEPEVLALYNKMKNTAAELYRKDIRLHGFNLKPERVRGIIGFEGSPARGFSVSEIPKTIFLPPDYNSEETLAVFLQKIINDPEDEDGREFFCAAFDRSVVAPITKTYEAKTTLAFTRYVDVRYVPAHKLFLEKLREPNTSQSVKMSLTAFLAKFRHKQEVLELFKDTVAGNSEDLRLYSQYMYGFGEIAHDTDEDVVNLLDIGSQSTDFYVRYNATLSLFKLDVRSRHDVHGKHKSEETIVSNKIKAIILDTSNVLFRIGLVTGLSSELVNNRHLIHYRETLEVIYLEFFRRVFAKSIDHLLICTKVVMPSSDILNVITSEFDHFNFTVSLGRFAEHFEQNGENEIAKIIYSLFTEGIIRLNSAHHLSILNQAIFLSKNGNPEACIKTFEWLIEMNPQTYEYYIYYLKILKFLEHPSFEKVKTYLLTNYEVSAEDRATIEAII